MKVGEYIINKKSLMRTTALGMMSGLFVGLSMPATAAIDELVVTAQKRAENMQDVPISMTAFGADTLANMGANRFDSFVDFIPNVNYNDNASIRATQITVRGIVSDANNIGVDQAAGIYVDGVYMGRPTTINTGMYDTERVEVLRGPQGTLYGKNVIAGAINIISKRPTNEFEGEVSLTYGNYDNKIAYGSVNIPLVDDTLMMRGSIQYEKRDGFIENLAGPDNNDADNLNGRISVLYQPNENLEFILRADAAKDRTHQGAGELAIVSPMLAAAPLNITPGHPWYVPNDPFDYKIADSKSSVQDRDVWGTSLEMNWDTGNGTLTSITAYRTFEWTNFQTSDLNPFDMFATGIIEDQEQFTQELRYSSSIGDRFEYIVGAYYFDMNLDAEPTALVGLDAFSIPAFGSQPLGSFPGPSESKLLPKVENESYAVFGQASYDLTDNLKVTGGLRYTKEKKSIEFSVVPDGVIVDPISPEVKYADMSEGVFSPMASLVYNVNDNVNTYFTYARGFKAGGFNAFDFNFANDDGSVPEFDPEFVDSYEVGVKTTLFDQRVRLNGSVFFMDYQDLQVNQRLEDELGFFFFRTNNAAEAESYGVELEMAASLTENVDITAAYGYVDSEYKSFVVDALNNVDYSGNSLVLSPEHTFSFAAQYTQPVANGWEMMVRGEYSYRTESYSDQANTEELENDARSLVNLRAGLENTDTGISITAWSRNLFEEEYTNARAYGSGLFAPGALQYAVGNPRTYGIELGWKF